MKTVLDVQDEINKSISEGESISNITRDGKKKIKKINNRIKFLKKIKAYLEFNPTEEFVQKEKKRLRSIISSCENNIKVRNIYDPKDKAHLRKESGATLAKQQLQTLNYIL